AWVPFPPSTSSNFTSCSPWLFPLMSLMEIFMTLPQLLFGFFLRFGSSLGRLLARDSGNRRLPTLRTFLGFTDDDVIAFGAGNRALDQQQIVRFANLDDFEVLRGALHLAQMAGHLHAAHNRAGEQALADGAGAAMPAFGAVRGITTSKRMAAHNTFKPAALGHANGVNEIARREQCRPND